MNNYHERLLSDWEDVFKQGLLTFWIFVALKNNEHDVQSLKQRIEQLTNNSYAAAEQTLYRVLRKHYDLELINYREVSGKSGPNKKLYTLSDLGKDLLEEFATKNIALFSKPEVQQLINGDK